MQTNFELLKEMKKRVLASSACVDSLLSVPPDSGRFNNPPANIASQNSVHIKAVYTQNSYGLRLDLHIFQTGI